MMRRKNYRMEAKLINGEALDVSKYPRHPGNPSVYVLPYVDTERELDYCSIATGEWVWAIAYNPETHEYFATTDIGYIETFKQNQWQLVWLR